MQENENKAFVIEVRKELGIEGRVVDFGVSRILTCVIRGRSAWVGTNGSHYWVSAALNWPSFPENSAIYWAPESSYARAKHLEDNAPPSTGDENFDSSYLLAGRGADHLARNLHDLVRAALVEHQSLRPEVGWILLSEIDPRLNVTARPSILHGSDFQSWALGDGDFTPVHAASSLERVVVLASRLESQ